MVELPCVIHIPIAIPYFSPLFFSFFFWCFWNANPLTLNGEMASGGGGELQMVLMGLEQGTLGVAKLCTGHLVCVYAEVSWDGRYSVYCNYIPSDALYHAHISVLEP